MMTKNVFLEKSLLPTPTQLAKFLGTRARYLDDLKRHIPGRIVEEWKHYGKTIGWTLKLILGKRNLCFIVICNRFFAISFVFGDKAVHAIEGSGLPTDLVQQVVNAKRYVEGRGIRLEVKSRRVLEQAKALLDIKRST